MDDGETDDQGADDQGADDREADSTDEEPEDPLEDIEWSLPPEGPDAPQLNDASYYSDLESADPKRCRELLADEGAFEPDKFLSGKRGAELYRAGAHLCAGDRQAGKKAYEQQVRDRKWPDPEKLSREGQRDVQQVQRRVCNVWDAVTRMVAPDAGPCTLERVWLPGPVSSETPEVTGETLGFDILFEADPQACQDGLLDDERFDPDDFETREAGFHLFRAGAHLCAGNEQAGDEAYQRALDFEWPPVEEVSEGIRERVCSIWDEVIRFLDPLVERCLASGDWPPS